MASTDALKILQEKAGYIFSDTKLLTKALTHPSLSGNSDVSPYERLEFLGDRVLGLVIADMLMREFPNEGEGAIAKRHTAVVQRKALAQIAGEISLGGFLLLSQGENDSGGRQKDTILADALEALIGAIYLDGGLTPVAAFIRRYWMPLVREHETPPEDPKTTLQEWAQAQEKPLPQYEVIAQTGPAHEPVFDVRLTVEGLAPVVASGGSKREAEKEAARALLMQIES